MKKRYNCPICSIIKVYSAKQICHLCLYFKYRKYVVPKTQNYSTINSKFDNS